MKPRKHARIEGTTVVITGAGSGIGRALAQRLSAHGCPVVLVDSEADSLAATAALLTTPTLVRALDVRDLGGLVDLAEEVRAWATAPIGAVFNNAGVAMSSTVAESSADDEARLVAINFSGVANGVRAFLPMLVEQESGAFVNTSSVYGLMGVPHQSAYCASKFAVRGYTEALREELRGTGVRAITVHPGGVRTNIARHAVVRTDPLGLGRTGSEMASAFEAAVRTTPERAAETIHHGVDRGKARILVGPDAHAVDLLARVAPSHAGRVAQILFRGLAGAAQRRARAAR